MLIYKRESFSFLKKTQAPIGIIAYFVKLFSGFCIAFCNRFIVSFIELKRKS